MRLFQFKMNVEITDPKCRLSLEDDNTTQILVKHSSRDFEELYDTVLNYHLPEITPHLDVDVADLDYKQYNESLEVSLQSFIAELMCLVDSGDGLKDVSESCVIDDLISFGFEFKVIELSEPSEDGNSA